MNAVWFKGTLDDDERQLVDLRSPEDYKNGTISDAINVEFKSDNFKREIGKLDRTIRTCIFSDTITSARDASLVMEEMGFRTITWLEVGYDEWPY